MSNEVKDIAAAFKLSGPIGKVIMGMVLVVAISLGFVVWFNLQNQAMITQIVRLNGNIESMVYNQESIGALKQNIKNTYDAADEYFNEGLLGTLGKVLAGAGVQFPQELNMAIQKYRQKKGQIKDCLITQ